MFGIIIFLMIVPYLRTTYFKIVPWFRFVPEHAVLYFVAFGRVVKYQTLVVFSTGRHHLIEHFEGGEYSEKGLVQFLPVLYNVFT